MTLKEIIDEIIKLLGILISWQFLVFLIIFILRNEIKVILLDLVKRISKAPGVWEFNELKEVKEEVASLINKSESENDKSKFNNTDLNPYDIRLKHSSEKIDNKYWRIKVWIEAPDLFFSKVSKVIYERHPTFKKRYYETSESPFFDSFKCWGEFTIKAQIYLKDGQIIKRQRYLTFDENSDDISKK